MHAKKTTELVVRMVSFQRYPRDNDSQRLVKSILTFAIIELKSHFTSYKFITPSVVVLYAFLRQQKSLSDGWICTQYYFSYAIVAFWAGVYIKTSVDARFLLIRHGDICKRTVFSRSHTPGSSKIA